MKLSDIIEKPCSGEWGTDDESGKGIPVLRTTNFTNEGIINYSNVCTRTIDKTKAAKKFLRQGDIIIEKSGGSDKQPVGRVVYFEGENDKYLYNNFTAALRVKDRNKWECKYVFYALFCSHLCGKTRMYQNKTTGLHNLQLTDYINDVIIPDNPLAIQREIAYNLDKVSEAIEQCRKILDKLDYLVKAKFAEMFEENKYPVLKWNDVFETTTGKLDSNAMDENGLYPFFTCSKTPLRINSYAFDQEALLLAGNNAVGKYDVKHYSGKFNAYQRTYVLTLKNNWSYELFKCQLENQLDYLQNHSLGGLTKYLTLKILSELKFTIPPLPLQEQFAEYVQKTDRAKAAVKKTLEKAQVLKAALMQKYFG